MKYVDVNAHLHTPYSFSAFENVSQALDMAAEEGVSILPSYCTDKLTNADNLVFSPGAVEQGIAAMKAGCTIVTDTQMAFSGVNKKVLEKFGGKAVCFMSDPDVAAEAKERGETRATVSMERAAALGKALTTLSTGDLRLFYRKYYYLQPTACLAAELGLTERAVEGRLYRIRKKLQQELGGDWR